MNKVSTALRLRRAIEHGLRRKHVAKYLGLSESRYLRMEYDIDDPPLIYIAEARMFADYLGLSVEAFIDLFDPEVPMPNLQTGFEGLEPILVPVEET